MERFGELALTCDQRGGLLQMSAATIDRRLAPARRRLGVKGRSGTKPGTLLKRHIPIRTFAQWDERRPGFLEVDLVAHDGGNASGDYCQSLTRPTWPPGGRSRPPSRTRPRCGCLKS